VCCSCSAWPGASPDFPAHWVGAGIALLEKLQVLCPEPRLEWLLRCSVLGRSSPRCWQPCPLCPGCCCEDAACPWQLGTGSHGLNVLGVTTCWPGHSKASRSLSLCFGTASCGQCAHEPRGLAPPISSPRGGLGTGAVLASRAGLERCCCMPGRGDAAVCFQLRQYFVLCRSLNPD